MKPMISVIGNRDVDRGTHKWELVSETAKALVDNGYRIVTGGVGTFSRAVFEGAQMSDRYLEGCIISIVPGFEPSVAYGSSDIQIATGLDQYRNVITANSDAVVAIGGGSGTLSELAFAWSLKRLVICVRVDGWSMELAGRKVDSRVRYSDIKEDQCFPAENAKDIIDLLSKYLNRYNRRHHRIP